MRDQAVAQKQESLLRAAVRLFGAKGFHGTSVREIAEAASIQRGSIYYYIYRKEDLLLRIIEPVLEENLAGLEQICRHNLSPLQALRRAIHYHVARIAAHASELAVAQQEMRHLSPEHRERIEVLRHQYERLFRGIIEGGIARGELRDLDPRLVSYAILGMCNWVVRWFSPEGPRSPEEVADLFADMVLGGLRAEASASPTRAAAPVGSSGTTT